MFDKIQACVVIIVILMVIGSICCSIGLSIVAYGNEETVEIVVKDKYIKRNSNSDIYMIVSKDNETYKITDLFFKGKYNSTDLYNQLEIGKKYKITTSGIRNHFLSEYKNINKIEKIGE